MQEGLKRARRTWRSVDELSQEGEGSHTERVLDDPGQVACEEYVFVVGPWANNKSNLPGKLIKGVEGHFQEFEGQIHDLYHKAMGKLIYLNID